MDDPGSEEVVVVELLLPEEVEVEADVLEANEVWGLKLVVKPELVVVVEDEGLPGAVLDLDAVVDMLVLLLTVLVDAGLDTEIELEEVKVENKLLEAIKLSGVLGRLDVEVIVIAYTLENDDDDDDVWGRVVEVVDVLKARVLEEDGVEPVNIEAVAVEALDIEVVAVEVGAVEAVAVEAVDVDVKGKVLVIKVVADELRLVVEVVGFTYSPAPNGVLMAMLETVDWTPREVEPPEKIVMVVVVVDSG